MPHNPHGLDGLTVLHLAQPVEGGVARVVTDLAAAQVRGGARVVVACPPGGPLAEAAAAAGAETVRWSARRAPGPGLARETTAAARVLADVDPDLLHLHSAKAGLAGRLAAHGTLPTVYQPHAWSYEAARGPAAAAAVRWERYAARWADRIVCVSEAERAGGQAHGIRAAWAVVPNGVDTARFTPQEPAAVARRLLPALRAAAWDTADVPLVVCVGRLCRQKGQDVLLRAWPAVAGRVPGARLVLVGDGPDRQRLAAAAPPGVLVAGAAEDPVPWYRAADVVVQPSRWEGMALAPLEAMACGRPVVMADVAGARESVPPEDAPHCLVPADDPPALAAAVTCLLTTPALRTAAAARALSHTRTHHDLRRTTAEVTALYTHLLAIPPTPTTWSTAPTSAAADPAAASPPASEPPPPPAGQTPAWPTPRTPEPAPARGERAAGGPHEHRDPEPAPAPSEFSPAAAAHVLVRQGPCTAAPATPDPAPQASEPQAAGLPPAHTDHVAPGPRSPEPPPARGEFDAAGVPAGHGAAHPVAAPGGQAAGTGGTADTAAGGGRVEGGRAR